ELPFVPGSEASGTVIEIGEGVTDVAVGDRVVTATARATYAEQFVVERRDVVKLPDGVDLELAGALPLQGCTAHYLAHSVSRVRAGETVLLHAGAGGVGLL